LFTNIIFPAYNTQKLRNAVKATNRLIINKKIIIAKVVTLDDIRFINGAISYPNIAPALLYTPNITLLLFLETCPD